MLPGVFMAYKGIHGDAQDELKRFVGLRITEKFFRDWHRIVTRQVDYWLRATWFSFGPIPIFIAEIDGRYAIYAVEAEPDGGLRVVVMKAGQGSFPPPGSRAEAQLRSETSDRLADFF